MLLALIAADTMANTRTATNLARNHLIGSQAETLADAAIHMAVLALLDPTNTILIPEDGTPFDMTLDAGTVVLSVQDEAGKLSLNGASAPELSALLTVLGVPAPQATELADAIADFRDYNDTPEPAGAEAAEYEAAGRPVGPKNDIFDAVEELQQVLGVTPALYRQIAPFVTVYRQGLAIDPDVAPPEVLLTVPAVSPADVERVMEERARWAEILLTGQRDQPLGSIWETAILPDTAFDQFEQTSRTLFTIRAQATIPGGAVFVREAVVHLPRTPQAPFEFLSWRRGERFAPDGG